MYDIYLFIGVRTPSPLERLATSVPTLKQSVRLENFQEHIQQHTPHFLHLNLDTQDIIRVFKYMRTGKAMGYILPAAYSRPQISLEEAKLLAESKATHYSNQSVASLQFAREEPVCWTFSALYDRKVRLHIDKLDGHFWQKSDLKRVWSMYYFLGDEAREMRNPYIIPAYQNNPDQTYDIHLTKGADQLPSLDDLASTTPTIQEPELQKRMLQRNMSLLPVALPRDKALELLYRLEREGAWGSLLSSDYRHPQITREQAGLIAEYEITKNQAVQRPNDTLGSVHFFHEDPGYWTFSASSAQLISEERTPGMIFTSVDKLDGHIWTSEELERFLEEN